MSKKFMAAPLSPLSNCRSVVEYLRRIEAELTGMKTARVFDKTGPYPVELGKVVFEEDGSVSASPDYEPFESEQAKIKAELIGVEWPRSVVFHGHSSLPAKLKKAMSDDPTKVTEFKNQDGKTLMYQVRYDFDGGRKAYVCFTYWSDGEWRELEPDGLLPLWGLDQLKKYSTVFIHEGAKAARAVAKMVAGETEEDRAALRAHPWGDELAAAAHVGWIGGARSPGRTNWKALKLAGVTHAYIVADNDDVGRKAVATISKALEITVDLIQFTDQFPVGFDLADEFPKRFFKERRGAQFYKGPSFFDCLHPATWATRPIFVVNKMKGYTLTDAFQGEWQYIEEMEQYVHARFPRIRHGETALNKMLRRFSDIPHVAPLILKSGCKRIEKLCYRPDLKEFFVIDGHQSALNVYERPMVRSVAGDMSIFHEFLAFLFPDEKDRKNVERWCATLIARPESRMKYALLLVSEGQGIGKSTIGTAILEPLIGKSNVSRPSENTIVGDFNSWLARKRLVIIEEIYQGQSWKAYNRLKSVITEADIDVNEKFEKPHTLQNWAHIFATSNSLKALKMDDKDRRWFIPTVTEEKWPPQKFAELYDWLETGGYAHVLHWAENYGDYVGPGEAAPNSRRKIQMVEESRSEALQRTYSLAEELAEDPKPRVISTKDLAALLRRDTQQKIFESSRELGNAMNAMGLQTWPGRISLDGKKDRVWLNQSAVNQLADESEEQKLDAIRKFRDDTLKILRPM